MAKNNRSRPRYEYPTFHGVARACPKCGSTSVKQIPGHPVVLNALAGITADGVEFTHVRNVKMICKCGRRFVLKEVLPKPQNNSIDNRLQRISGSKKSA